MTHTVGQNRNLLGGGLLLLRNIVSVNGLIITRDIPSMAYSRKSWVLGVDLSCVFVNNGFVIGRNYADVFAFVVASGTFIFLENSMAIGIFDRNGLSPSISLSIKIRN